MSRTWKPTTAGIINVVCGSFLLISGVTLFSLWNTSTATSFAGYVMYSLGHSGGPETYYTNAIVTIIALACIILGIISILGGIHSIKRRLWGVALTGSISTFVYLLFFGVPAIVFTALSKDEFHWP